VARATIRQALGLLESEGLISRHRAKGTFVEKRPQDLLWLEVKTDWQGLLSRRDDVRIEVLSDTRNVQPSLVPHPIGKLGENYRHLRRRHWREQSPFLLADVFIDADIATRIEARSFSELTALRLISQVPGLEISDARQTLTIGTTEIETAALMNLPLNAPIANVHRTAVASDGKIVLISLGIYRGDIVRVDTRLKS